ncbi:MAG: ATP-binding cassette domain-containing protein [Hyphomicrobiales bacterium]|nr:ATP-binding cassette domain-containing protein [Hyphomicrobiales bacterium]
MVAEPRLDRGAARTYAVTPLRAETVISLRNVSRTYISSTGERVEALKGVTFDVRAGEFLVIRGESGSGKTTLLRILGLLDNEFTGDYLLGGAPVAGKPDWWLDEARSANIGFVFQEGRLFDHLSLEKNITVPYRLGGGDKRGADLRKSVERDSQNFFSDKERGQRIFGNRPLQASGGQRQRVAIMRAIKRRPPIILADEPTASLDTPRKKIVLDMLKQACAQGYTVVVVSHDSIFYDTGRQIEIKSGVATELPPGALIQQTDVKPRPVRTDFSALATGGGWWPRADILTLGNQVIQETFGRPAFLFLILIALLAGICQISVFCSLLAGTQQYVEESIKSGSRLNRVEIKPRQTDREAAKLFPEREAISKNPVVEAALGRRESTARLVLANGDSTPYVGMGLQQNDPEFKQLYFYAGGPFSSESALEIIVTAGLVNDLFDVTALREGRESFQSFIGRSVTVRVPQFTETLAARRTVEVKFKVVGVIAAGEGGRQLYFPMTPVLAMDQMKRDRTDSKPQPFNAAGDGWALNPEELKAYVDFPWEDRLQIYTVAVRDVIPIYAEMARLGYRPETEFWRYKWVLDIQDLAWKIFVPMLILIVFVVGLTVFTNIYTSAKMREKDFALWRILGMRIGDLSFTQLFSTIIVVLAGAVGGLALAASIVEGARSLLRATSNVPGQPDALKNLESIFSPIGEFAPVILAGALVVGVLAAVIPALRAARTDPAKILQSG